MLMSQHSAHEVKPDVLLCLKGADRHAHNIAPQWQSWLSIMEGRTSQSNIPVLLALQPTQSSIQLRKMSFQRNRCLAYARTCAELWRMECARYRRTLYKGKKGNRVSSPIMIYTKRHERFILKPGGV